MTRILVMVPVYSLAAWFAFFSLKTSVYMEVIEKGYEGFVVWSFFQLCLEYLGDGDGERLATLKMIPDGRLPFPFRFLPSRPSQPEWLKWCKIGVLQYVFINTCTAVLALITQWVGVYCIESNSPRYAHVYLSLINAASVSCAMFSLFAYYLPLHHKLSERKPNPIMQFISVKFIIFFNFWLVFVIKALCSFDIIKSNGATFTQSEFSTFLQAFIVLCEMSVAAVVHVWAFTAKTYYPDEQRNAMSWKKGVYDTFMYFDFIRDAQELSRGVHRLERRLTHRNNPAPTQLARPVSHQEPETKSPAIARGAVNPVDDAIHKPEKDAVVVSVHVEGKSGSVPLVDSHSKLV
ncbi:hypothetical protein HDV03_003673 [Kappamyces sp. JEL0829]|nr:hypothetical protein HDV03_003673 [Kappamyces sp. JEL0829]